MANKDAVLWTSAGELPESYRLALEAAVERCQAEIAPLPATIVEQALLFSTELLKKNEVMNLTGLTAPDEVALKHFLDSWSPLPELDRCLAAIRAKHPGQPARILDLGSGAGFPGIPLLLARPETDWTLLDALQKRCRFLDQSLAALALQSSARALHGRAEELARQTPYRERFDLVTARAVADLHILLEYALPFVRLGGHFIAMKAERDESAGLERVLQTLGGSLVSERRWSLPQGAGERQILLFRKVAATPAKYPRNGGQITKKPL